MANVELSDSLYQDLEQIVKASQEFKTVNEYVSYILQQVVEKKKQQTTSVANQDSKYSQADEDKIRERLKNLGYLD